MKKNKIILVFITIISLFSTTVFAAIEKLPEPSFNFYVYDEANIIDERTENYIINVNKELSKKIGAQIVIATINDLGKEDIRLYANKLFEKWKVGSKEYNNGLLVLIVPKDREVWIEIGYGLEGPIPDSRAKRIIENSIFPYFRDNDFSNGVLSGFNEIVTLVEEEYNIDIEREGLDENLHNIGISSDESRNSSIYRMILILLLILYINSRLNRGRRTYRNYGGYSGYRGYGSSPRGGRSGGGGFGGFSGGGGRSGGGGAGGKW